MRIGRVRHIFFGKQKFLTKKMFGTQFWDGFSRGTETGCVFNRFSSFQNLLGSPVVKVSSFFNEWFVISTS